MRIITALGNESLNLELQKNELFEMISADIQYQEALIEIIKNNQNCEVLIISELLYGEKNIKELLINILNINPRLKIITILEKENEELRIFLISIGVYKVFINNQINYEEVKNIIRNINLPIKINDDNSIIKKKNNKMLVSSICNIKNKFIDLISCLIEKNNESSYKKIISLVGISGCGKSTFSALISEYLRNNKIKTILIDFNIFNNSINTIFGVNKYPNTISQDDKINNIQDLIIKIDNYLSLICGIDLYFNEVNKIEESKIISIFNELKKHYDLIILDLSSDVYLKYCKLLLKNSDDILFLLEPSLIEIKKSLKLIKCYVNDWNIEKSKFSIIINKSNVYSIDEKIIQCIFSDYKIKEKFKYSYFYNYIISCNLKNILIDKKTKMKLKKLV